MTLTSSKRWFTAFLVGLLLCLQLVSSAHATGFDEQPHEHDCIMCLVSVNQGDDQAVLPTPPIVYVRSVLQPSSYVTSFTSALYIRPFGRAPPPRSPPAPLQ